MSEGLSAKVAEANYNRQQARLELANQIRWGEQYKDVVEWLRSLDLDIRDKLVRWINADSFDIDDEIPRCMTPGGKQNILLGQKDGPYDKFFNKNDGGDAA